MCTLRPAATLPTAAERASPWGWGCLSFPDKTGMSVLNNFSSPALLDLCGFENVNSPFRCSHLLEKKRKEKLQIQNFCGDSVATAGEGHHGPRDLSSAPAISSLPHHLPFSWLGSLPGNHISFITVAALQPSLANFPVACGVFQLIKCMLYFRLESPNSLEEFLLSLLCPYCPHSLKKEKKERHIKSETQPLGTYSECHSTPVSYSLALLFWNIENILLWKVKVI